MAGLDEVRLACGLVAVAVFDHVCDAGHVALEDRAGS